MSTSLDMSPTITENGIGHNQSNERSSFDDPMLNLNIERIAAEIDLNGQDESNSSARMFERTRIQVLADERGHVQKKTFTKWVNSHLTRVGCRINDLYTDLSDGRMLIRLLEILSGERLPKATRGKMRIHCLENVDKAIMFLQEQHVHLENIGAHDIVDGNSSLILGLIWTMILRFQIQDITMEDCEPSETRSAKDALLLWCQMKTAGYPNINVRNFTTSWKDGLAFCALIHKHRPDLLPQMKSLSKDNANENLQLAFDICERRLGISRLLDPEDVNVEYIDEKSIITYLVTLYHYFSKMKNDSVQGRRLTKVVGAALDAEKMAQEYERLVSDLLIWIERTIRVLNDRQFPNCLLFVQEKLVEFNRYRLTDKPSRFAEKGNLEVLLFTLQSKERANQQTLFQPREGKMISDVNRAWENLERAEHERELALREEILRQERLEQLATKFNRKAALREKWLIDSEKLVASDQFGSDLASVEAAFKKQEAIQTDIAAFEERLQNIMAIANELQTEDYHDYSTIESRKKNVEMHWEYLVGLVSKRRQCLELSYNLQRVFQEMEYILEWINDLKWRLKSDEIEKYLITADDLLQRHSLIETDLFVIDKRLKRAITDVDAFLDPEFNVDGFRPTSNDEIEQRIEILQKSFEELTEMARNRRQILEQAKQLSKFYSDVADTELWVDENQQTLTSPDLGHDVVSVENLLSKQKLTESDINNKLNQLQHLNELGETMSKQTNFSQSKINERLENLKRKWDHLVETSNDRDEKLKSSKNYFQFFSEADDINTWMLDMLKLVSSEDVGRDELSVQNLLKKHKDLNDVLENYRTTIDKFQEKYLENFNEEQKTNENVEKRFRSIETSYDELLELSKLRKQKLHDAHALFRLINEADNVEAWVEEKERFLASLDPTQVNDIEQLEVIKHRFDGFERDMNSTASKVAIVGHQARTLVQADHPNSQEILDRINKLNQNWAQLRRLVDRKRDDLSSTFGVQTFHIECNETVSWIKEKIRIVQSTEDLSRDLAGVMTMQRRLTGLERDMAAIQSKLDQLESEAAKLEKDHPEDAITIDNKVRTINSVWYELKEILGRREASMGEAAELQKFLRDLDHFSAWLTRTQTLVANEDIPNNLNEAENFLNQHQTIKEEIDRYGPDYNKMKDYSHRVIRDADRNDPQYIFLRERLNALDDGWTELEQMCQQKKNMLTEALQNQMFLRDANQAEIFLSHQQAFLSFENETKPKSFEEVESQIKKHEDFLASLTASEEKILGVHSFAERLCQENHHLSERIWARSLTINERFILNRQMAGEIGEKLDESLKYFQFIQDCDDLKEWLEMKSSQAQDDSYRDTSNIHTKYLRHQAFQAEIQANKERLVALKIEAEKFKEERPQTTEKDLIDQQVKQLDERWAELEEKTRTKGERLFDANRSKLFHQSIKNLDDFMSNIEKHLYAGESNSDTIDGLQLDETNLTSTNILLLKQTTIEDELREQSQRVEELRVQAEKLKQIEPNNSTEIDEKRFKVEEKFSKLLEPLEKKKIRLEQQKRLHQYLRDIEDEFLWLEEKRQLSENYGEQIYQEKQNLMNVQLFKRKSESLIKEIDHHQQGIFENFQNECRILTENYPKFAEDFRQRLEKLSANYSNFKEILQQQRENFDVLELIHQFYNDLSEAEAWLGEQELYLINEERGKDEFSTQTLIRQHLAIEQSIGHYGESLIDFEQRQEQIRDKIEQSNLSNFIFDQHKISLEKRVEILKEFYRNLLDLSNERRQRLDQAFDLHRIHRDIDDFEQWISDRELIAGSHELGQDFEHVSMLRDRFSAFSQETLQIGSERLQTTNEMIDLLIAHGHMDSAQIAEYKDTLNESFQDLLELIETRSFSLTASLQLHKFFHDCKETNAMIVERKNAIPDDLARDQQAVQQSIRKHQQFESELVLLAQDIQRLQQESVSLTVSYAGERQNEIHSKLSQVLEQWKSLQNLVDQRKNLLNDYDDFYRFSNLVRDLTLYMDGVIRQMTNSNKPRDVTGVDLLINNHQSLKAEIHARQENFTMTINLGKGLIKRRHQRSSEIKDKCVKLSLLRDEVDQTWSERWEYLQLILEVYQFARDAAIAETWLVAQESYLNNEELGESVDQVENLLKRHEQFEKSLLAQEDRFNALRNLTTLEKKHQTRENPIRTNLLENYLEEFQTWEEISRRSESPAIQQSPKPSNSDPPSIITEEKQIDSQAELIIKEGFLSRKHQWESLDRKATHRTWEKFYCVLTNFRFSFYKDVKNMKLSRTIADDFLFNAVTNVSTAIDYRKKSNVFSWKFNNGNEFLFHAKDETEMTDWINSINNCISSHAKATRSTSPSMTPSPKPLKQSTMISSTSGAQISESSIGTGLKSRTLPIRSHSLVEESSTSSNTNATTNKKKPSKLFSRKPK